MLGFSGGRKLVVPGLAAQETIKVIHSPRFMRHPRAVEGSVEGNPLHAELLEIAGIAGHDFIVDVALTRSREIAAVFAGGHAAALSHTPSTAAGRKKATTAMSMKRRQWYTAPGNVSVKKRPAVLIVRPRRP